MSTEEKAKSPKELSPASTEKSETLTTRKKHRRKRASKTRISAKKATLASKSAYPRHTFEQCLRIPRVIIEQNAAKECTEKEAATFVGVGYGGPFQLEISSCIKFSLLERPSTGRVKPTDLAKSIIRPQSPEEALKATRQAIVNAPSIADVYNHYRGENLPDDEFFRNALTDKFSVPVDKIQDFIGIFISTLASAKLIEEKDGKRRILDVAEELPARSGLDQKVRKIGKEVKLESGDSCFVMMPFAPPIGDYYSKIYEPAIRKAGLVPVRADTEIFGTGKIVEQVWRGISNAKVLVAELTGRNPNVFYELGLAHASGKAVVLVSSNQNDVPFDLQHIRVIYYDVNDPFWGSKLIEKVSENILSALQTPEEAKFQRAVSGGEK